MRAQRYVFSVLALAGCALPAYTSDLGKLDRSIAKEPSYQSKAPRYCLVLFGPDAKHRVWLVEDGEVVYVNRNGNGDLTEDGEQVPLPKPKPFGADGKEPKGSPAGEARVVQLGDITDGQNIYRGLELVQMRIHGKAVADDPARARAGKDTEAPDGWMSGLSVTAEPHRRPEDQRKVPGKLYQRTQGSFRFADRAQDAPVIHFSGPLTMQLLEEQTLVRGDTTVLRVLLGTKGLGAGTFATVFHENLVPRDLHPIAEIELPPRNPGTAPVKLRVILDGRC